MGNDSGKRKRQILFAGFAVCYLLSAAISARAEEGRAYLNTHSLSGAVRIKSWKTLRDERIVKQDLDYSCGAASLATLLNEHYGQAVTEEQLLAAMDTGDLMASFEDMRRAVAQFGFLAAGFAASYDQLTKLKMPVVVYLKHRKTEHFSVLRGINESTVWLADPSQGNRTYSRWQFLDMWVTQADNTNLKGRVLGVLPMGTSHGPSDFFTKSPKRQTALVVKRIQALPDRIAPSLHQSSLWP